VTDAWLRVDNSIRGFKKLAKWVSEQTNAEVGKWLVCMEHTGSYSYRLNLFLQEQSICQCMINPLAIKRSMGIIRGKNDRADARTIAQYAKRFEESLEFYQLPSEALQKLKIQLVQRERMINMKRQLELGNDSLKDMPTTITQQVTKQNNQLRKQLVENIKELDKLITETVRSEEDLNSQAKMIESIPGVGPQISAHVLVATQGMTRFKSSRKFACYCGVAPFEYTSGSSYRAKTKVHYLANKKLKSLFHLGALSALQIEGDLKQYYERKLAEGKNPMCVINAVRFKLIDRIFAVVRRGENYERNYIKKAA
jgi:transposase